MEKRDYKSKGIGGHQSARAKTVEYLTPPHILKALGQFDLDPCSPVLRPWDTAKKHYTIMDNGLVQPWEGRIWLNPPYGGELEYWLKRMYDHNNGIALTFARTDTKKTFHRYVFSKATSMYHLEGRLTFLQNKYLLDPKTGQPVSIVETVKCRHNSGGPSVLIAYGEYNSHILDTCGLPGFHAMLNLSRIIIVGFAPSWKLIIDMVITRLNGEAEVQQIYTVIERNFSHKLAKNKNYREKIRQQLQRYFIRKKRGVYSNAG
jgi:hypothetical protein